MILMYFVKMGTLMLNKKIVTTYVCLIFVITYNKTYDEPCIKFPRFLNEQSIFFIDIY